MGKYYVVQLSTDERARLELIRSRGKSSAAEIKHANLLLAMDANGPALSDAEAAGSFGCHVNTARNVRQRCVELGLDAALARKPQERPSRTRIFDGECEARLIAAACTKPPPGHARWTLLMLADKVVELEIVPAASPTTIGRVLKKMNSART